MDASLNLAAESGPALPPEAPLRMPRQPVDAPGWPARPGLVSLPRAVATALVRTLLLLSVLGLTGFGVHEMYAVMASGGVTLLQWGFLIAFALSFAWISHSACQAAIGFVRLLWRDLFRRRRRADGPPTIRTAVLMPLYNEDPVRAAASVRVMAEGLAERAPGAFAFFLLSDTNRVNSWIHEEHTFSELIEAAPAGCPVYYRHRRDNAERKAGNIAEWVTRWGGAYEAMLVLDADSLIEPDTMVEMAHRLEASPALGLLQTLPAVIEGESLFARLQQFANRCYGPVYANGLASWYGVDGNFWGHNAIIRTCAFAECARLPILPGKAPFGGHVLSHDFVEAAMLRRGGWGVRFDTDLRHSFEETPPSLTDVMVRDRRWCQGNMQHVRFLMASGFPLASRVHLMTGILSYFSAPLWLLLIAIGLVLSVQVALSGPEYFSEPSLFPIWPVFDSERAIRLFVVSMGVVVTPKLLGLAAAILNPRRCLSFGGPILVTLGVAAESVLSALYAPVLMMSQSHTVWDVLRGRDSGWKPQRRGDGSIPLGVALRTHFWHALSGLAIGGVILAISQGIFYWTLPLTGALVLSPLLSCLSGSRRAGRLLRRLGLLRTPEERRRSRAAILDKRAAALPATAAEPRPALIALAADAELNAWHRRQLEGDPFEPGFDPDLVIGRAKAAREADLRRLSVWLNPAEQLAYLHDPPLVESLLSVERPIAEITERLRPAYRSRATGS